MNVIVVMPDGREAIPVRALPYVFPALTPHGLIAELTHFKTIVYPRDLTVTMCQQGREKDDRGNPKPRTGRLYHPVAYHLDDGAPEAIAPNDWHRIGRPITERDEKPNVPGQDYSDEIALLPAGVFLWRDECKAEGRFSPLVPEAMRAVIMEGFERFLAPAVEPPAPAAEPPHTGPEPEPPSALPVIGAMLALFLKDTDSDGKKLSPYSTQNELIEALLDRNPMVRGLSDRNLKGIFSDANKAIREARKA